MSLISFRSSFRAFALGVVVLLGACGAADTSEPVAIPPVDVPDSSVVPAQGTSATLDIGNWNLEWFGDPTNAPANDSLQIANAKTVIAGADADIWGLVEVVNTSAWNTIKSIPGYAGVLANDAGVAGGSSFYSMSEQKPACLFKTSIATLTSAELILTAKQSDFAGRPPLECKLHVTLGGASEDIVVIVQHMKAFDDLSSYDERLAASADLKAYLDATYPTQKVIVIGDWNDDINQSITPGMASPYANFVADSVRYTFATKALTAAHAASTTDYPNVIDHQLATNEMYATYVAGSAEVFRADAYIASYGTTTSDHYPVISRWNVMAP